MSRVAGDRPPMGRFGRRLQGLAEEGKLHGQRKSKDGDHPAHHVPPNRPRAALGLQGDGGHRRASQAWGLAGPRDRSVNSGSSGGRRRGWPSRGRCRFAQVPIAPGANLVAVTLHTTVTAYTAHDELPPGPLPRTIGCCRPEGPSGATGPGRLPPTGATRSLSPPDRRSRTPRRSRPGTPRSPTPLPPSYNQCHPPRGDRTPISPHAADHP